MKKLVSAVGLATLLVGSLSLPASASATTTTTPSSWGLDRIDQTTSQLDNSYTYPSTGGAGVRVYVLDTGVEGNLMSFGGRVLPGFDATTPRGGTANTDCHGHGTHVAGTIASSRYGVAPKATIVPVRVATCQGGVSSTWISNGLKWVLDNHPAGTPGVINLSVAVMYNEPVNNMADRLFRAGLVVVAASGNYNMDACRLSPGSTKAILTVGAVNNNSFKTNGTTFGDCIDMYAPGGTITSEDPKLASRVRTGTSMAAPHVSGAAALYLGNNPQESPAMVNHLLSKYATEGAIPNLTDGVNKLLNIGFINERSVAPAPAPELDAPTEITEPVIAPEPPAPVQTIADAPTNLYVMGGSTTMSIVWTAPANASAVQIQHYRIEYSYDNGKTWRLLTRVTPETTQAQTAKPIPGTLVTFRVLAVTAGGNSEPSKNVTIRIPR